MTHETFYLVKNRRLALNRRIKKLTDYINILRRPSSRSHRQVISLFLYNSFQHLYLFLIRTIIKYFFPIILLSPILLIFYYQQTISIFYRYPVPKSYNLLRFFLIKHRLILIVFMIQQYFLYARILSYMINFMR